MSNPTSHIPAVYVRQCAYTGFSEMRLEGQINMCQFLSGSALSTERRNPSWQEMGGERARHRKERSRETQTDGVSIIFFVSTFEAN